MTREQAIKKVSSLVMKGIKCENAEYVRQAEKIADKYNVFMAFDEEYIAVEDDMFYLNEH